MKPGIQKHIEVLLNTSEDIRQKSQAKFGRKFNRSYLDIGRIERGEVRPTAELLFNICIEYKVNLEWVITGKGPMKKEKSITSSGYSFSERPSIKEMGCDILFRPEEEKIGSILMRKGLIDSKDLQVALMEQGSVPVELLRHESDEVRKAILRILRYRKESREDIKRILSLDNLIEGDTG